MTKFHDILQDRVRECAEPDPDSAFKRGFAGKAAAVEMQLRRLFGRISLFVLPGVQKDGSRAVSIPSLRVIDGLQFGCDAQPEILDAARTIASDVFDTASIYVSAEDVSVMPDGDGLKYVVEDGLAMRFGHRGYSVEYGERARPSSPCLVEIFNLCGPADTRLHMPQMIVDAVMERSKTLRPDIHFQLSDDVQSQQRAPVFAPGFISGLN